MTGGRTKTSKFSDHTQDDAALAAPEQDKSPKDDLQGLTFLGRLTIFLLFPTSIGLLGLYTGYLTKRDDPDLKLSFDSDFAYPFVLALTLAIVVGFRTGGFKSATAKPLVAWPKVKKRRKIVHKHVVAGQDPDAAESENVDVAESGKDEQRKKED
jgi:hypothetical protein